jgi:hypothetical protein
MATRHALTPADLGLRSSLLVQKHAAYIASFSNIWEVRLWGEQHKDSSSTLSAQSPADRLSCLCPQTHSPTQQQGADKLEHVATEHFWMSGMYWGLTAMALMGRLDQMDSAKVLDWVSVVKQAADSLSDMVFLLLSLSPSHINSRCFALFPACSTMRRKHTKTHTL